MLAYHSGFSVDTGVLIESDDRAALERLLRYCARPPFAMERLSKEGTAVAYRCAKQHSEPISDKRGGRADELHLTALELIARIAALVPPKRSKAHCLWAVLIARIYEVFALLCPLCSVSDALDRFHCRGRADQTDSGVDFLLIWNSWVFVISRCAVCSVFEHRHASLATKNTFNKERKFKKVIDLAGSPSRGLQAYSSYASFSAMLLTLAPTSLRLVAIAMA